jgi:hypothetical protein
LVEPRCRSLGDRPHPPHRPKKPSSLTDSSSKARSRKNRLLQKKKGALANDILGEENFARALTLEDFNFLFSEQEN